MAFYSIIYNISVIIHTIKDGKIYCIMGVNTYSLICIHFPLRTLIDSFVWKEIFHGTSSDISGWYHCLDAYSTPARWSRVKLCVTTRIAWCCLFSYFISELWRDGLWACPQLSSYFWWGYEYNMYRCWQNYTSTFWGKLMYVSYSTDRPGGSAGRPADALAIICLWVLLTWLTYAYGMLCQDDIAPREFFPCAYHFVWLGTSTHVCSWSITDRYIIKRHGSHASWYVCWTINALVEAEVFGGITVIGRGIAVPLIIARLF